ncbi:MAG: hypothetical protein ACRC2R_08560 [Xenococcaceae cyanobacterium]
MKAIDKFSSIALIFVLQLLGSNCHAGSMTINTDVSNIDLRQLEWRDRGHFVYTESFLTEVSLLNTTESQKSQLSPNLSDTNKNLKKDSRSNSWGNLVKSWQGIKLNGNDKNSFGQTYVPILARVEYGDIYKDVYDYNITLDNNNISNRDSDRAPIASAETLDSSKTNNKIGFLKTQKQQQFELPTKSLSSNKLISDLASLNLIPDRDWENSSVAVRPSSSNLKSTLGYSKQNYYNIFKENTIFNRIQRYQFNYSINDRYNEQQSPLQRDIANKLAIKHQQFAIQQQQQRIEIEQKMRQAFEERQTQQQY